MNLSWPSYINLINHGLYDNEKNPEIVQNSYGGIVGMLVELLKPLSL